MHINPAMIYLFALSIIESQARGLPIVSRENNVIFDYVYHNETGFITNIQIILQKNYRFTSDNSFFKNKNNAKLNNKINDWQTVVESFEKKYMKILFIVIQD